MVRPGYKQTEIGVIPEDWEAVAFEDCFRILPNNTLSRAELNENGGTVKNVHYGDILIKYGSILNCSTALIPFVSDPTKHFSSGLLMDGDIIITDTAEDETVGAAVELFNAEGQKIVAGLHTIPCRTVNPERFANGWLGYYINHSIYHDQLLPCITGTKVSSVSKSSIAKTIILIPPLSEQKRIAEALSDADELIASLEKLIAKKKAVKQGAMQQLLTGRTRLPGFSGAWQKIAIGNCGHLLKESVNPQLSPVEYFWEYSMPAFDEGEKPIKQTGNDMHSNRTRIAGMVLLFNKLNVRQKRIWLIKQCLPNAVCSSEFLPYCSESVDLRLLKHILATDNVTADFVGISTGTSNSQKRITSDSFLEYQIYIPTEKEEQIAISELLDDMDTEIIALEQKLAKTRQIKQGMMQQLLTGKIRLV